MVERLDECVAGNLESAAQIIPDRDAEFVAGLGEAQESITAVAADIAARPGTDLTAGGGGAGIVLPARGVGGEGGGGRHPQTNLFFWLLARPPGGPKGEKRG